MSVFFFFNDTATTEIYTLSLHDALPISGTQTHVRYSGPCSQSSTRVSHCGSRSCTSLDRKSTRLNSSHMSISYAVFCLKKKKETHQYVLPFILCMPLLPASSHALPLALD